MTKLFLILLIEVIPAISFGQPTPSRVIFQKLHYCKLPGVSDSVLCGSIPVIENRQTSKGRIIRLNVVVVPALHSNSLLAPIFDIDGGPGLADTKNADFYADASNPLRQHHDIVLVDVRGTGKSNSLYCPSLQNRPTLKEQLQDMFPPEAVKQCYSELSQHADLTQYTTTNVVKDFEDVRKWLGYNKIELFSLSYGTRVALVYMKMFPASIEGCILWSPIATYGRMPLYHALYAQNTLEKIFSDCKNDSSCSNSFPSFENEFNSLEQKAKQEPLRFTWKDSSGHAEQYSVTWDVLAIKIRELMYSPQGLRTIPFIVHQLYLGNFEPFVKLYTQDSDTTKNNSLGFYLCVTCAEDVPFIPRGEINSITKGTFVGTYRIDQQEMACANWVRGVIPKDFLDTIHSNVPTLIFSGGFDPVTPPSFAKEIASHLPNSTLVTIPQMSHMIEGLSHLECFIQIALNFLDHPSQPKLNLDCVKQMKRGPFKLKE
jgi:pimeloyl-ACP methyl ester carboxylesterase